MCCVMQQVDELQSLGLRLGLEVESSSYCNGEPLVGIIILDSMLLIKGTV